MIDRFCRNNNTMLFFFLFQIWPRGTEICNDLKLISFYFLWNGVESNRRNLWSISYLVFHTHFINLYQQFVDYPRARIINEKWNQFFNIQLKQSWRKTRIIYERKMIGIMKYLKERKLKEIRKKNNIEI